MHALLHNVKQPFSHVAVPKQKTWLYYLQITSFCYYYMKRKQRLLATLQYKRSEKERVWVVARRFIVSIMVVLVGLDVFFGGTARMLESS